VPADPWTVLGAALVEGATGYPAALHARLPHPVSWLAWEIRALDRGWNRPTGRPWVRRVAGVATLALVAGGAGLVGFGLDRVLGGGLIGAAAMALIGSLGLAARNLHDHVAAVSWALEAGDLPAARTAVGRIVGRDVQGLDAEGVAAAALESLAESFNDGVVAPLAWFLAGGLCGLFAFKAVNTADSLIGHREDPYGDFGWASARTDDLMGLVPARIAGGLLCLAGGCGWRVMLREAGKHASPNAGWPEAAMAGALGIRLGGPASYDGVVHSRPEFGQGPGPTAADLRRGQNLYLRACAPLVLALAAGGLVWPR